MGVVGEKEPPFRSHLVVNGQTDRLDGRIAPGKLEHAIGVVVAAHQSLAPVQALEHGTAMGTVGVGREIADMPNLVVDADGVVPARDQDLVVRLQRGERRTALAQNVGIAEMRVGREENGHRGRFTEAVGRGKGGR